MHFIVAAMSWLRRRSRLAVRPVDLAVAAMD
jgi:hypothetical protein